MDEVTLEQRHGKARVRIGRVWREPHGAHHFVEWNVSISLLSDCFPAYAHGDNSDIVATDTMKNTVYVKAKECKQQLSAEDFAIVLGKHFTSFYHQVTAAIINIVEKPWERINIHGQPHEHGFKLGSEKHTTEVIVKKSGALQVISGIQGLTVLKTTQSGFEEFIRDKYTILPETRERMLATEVTASWRYPFETLASIPAKQLYFMKKYMDVKKVLIDTFFGPVKGGVYSPSVQSTLYHMAKAVLDRVSDVSSIQLKMPNIHFLPVNLSSKDNPIIVKVLVSIELPKGTQCSWSHGSYRWSYLKHETILQVGKTQFINSSGYYKDKSIRLDHTLTLEVESIFAFFLPFEGDVYLPTNEPIAFFLPFEGDVYLPTDEPHGSIEATLSRIRSKM